VYGYRVLNLSRCGDIVERRAVANGSFRAVNRASSAPIGLKPRTTDLEVLAVDY